MNWLDIAILVVIALSILVSLWRGFLREVLALLVWVVAFGLAFVYAPEAGALFGQWVTSTTAQNAVGFVAVFLLVVVVGGLLSFVLGKMVDKTGLGGTDRLLGGVFGLLRGGLIVVLAVMLAGFTALPTEPWWQNAKVVPTFERIAMHLANWLPAGLDEQLRFAPQPIAGEADATQPESELVAPEAAATSSHSEAPNGAQIADSADE